MQVLAIDAKLQQRQSRVSTRGMRLTRMIAAWLTILAMTLNALWPLIVNAKPKSIPQEICSVVGTRTIADTDGAQPAPAAPMHHDHLSDCCTYCVGGVHAAPLAPALSGLAFNLQPDPLLFASADAITWKCPYYLPTLSRGPPASPI